MIHRSPEQRGDLDDVFSGVGTLPALLARRVALSPHTAAYFTRTETGEWRSTTWGDFATSVAVLASGLAREGVTPGTRVGILAATSLDWEIAQMAALACGATIVGLDPYYPNALLNRLVRDLRITALVADTSAALARIEPEQRSLLQLVALMRHDESADDRSVATLRTIADHAGDTARPDAAHPDAPAVVAFSSGSSGTPKPVSYTHAQVIHACRCILDLYPELGTGTRLVCWLPLANLFQRMINFTAIALAGTSYVVEDPREVMAVVPIANPHVFMAVPRFCEKLHAGITARLRERPAMARVVEASLRVARHARAAAAGGSTSLLPRAAATVADRFVLARLRAVMGTNLRFIVSGSAPMPLWLLQWFEALGIPVLEAYGASENLVPITANRVRQRKPGTVGKPVGDNEVRISDTGEVLVRGRGVFDPSLAENRERAGALTADGFLATGDLGAFDADGFLTLQGRRSDVFKNAQGRWVSLLEIEAALRRVPGVEHAAVIPVDDELVVVLALEASTAGDLHEAIAQRDSQVGGTRWDEALRRELANLPGAMQPGAVLIAREGFSPASGELTTNLKLRRAAIRERFGDALRAAAARVRSSGARGQELPFVAVV